MSEEQLEPQETPQEKPQFAEEKTPQNPFPPQNGGFNAGFNGGFNGMQQALPNATAVLVLGILSIVTCCCYGVIGTILAIIALVLYKKDRLLYEAYSANYTESSFKNLSAGRVCAIIGLILSLLYLVFSIAMIIFFGFGALNDKDELRRALEGMR